jgi:hypothetical protein
MSGDTMRCMGGSTRAVAYAAVVIATAAIVLVLLAFAPASAGAKTALSWLAAGDSYSSGEGLPHATGHCAQARPGSGSLAWADLAHDDLAGHKPTLQVPLLTACTGAVTSRFFDSQRITYYGRHPTLPAEWVPSMGRFDLVSFTFGGDDVGFAGVITQCVTKPALRRSCPSEPVLRARIASFGQGYRSFLVKVADEAVVHGGNVLVLGYPELVEDPALWSARARALGCAHLTPSDATELRGLAGDLNSTIGQDVAVVDREQPNEVHFTFVDVNSGGSAGISRDDPDLFESASGPNHNLCSRDPWINPLSVIDRGGGSYHPKQAGQNAMGTLAAEVITRLHLSPVRSGAPQNPKSCARLNGLPVLAYNISCSMAAAVIRQLPAGWTGANNDTPIGHGLPDGIAFLYPAQDSAEVLAAHTSSTGAPFSTAKLHGAPVVWFAEPYGE